MALLGSAAVAMWWDMAPDMRDEFEDWHSHEHFPERMSIPGFRRGSRWADANGGPGFFVIYELQEYETLVSSHYLARLNDPTPWSKKMMPHHQNMVRSQCRVVESHGGGIARCMLTLRLAPAQENTQKLRDELGRVLKSLPTRPGVTGGHLLLTDTPAAAMTTEQQIRGGDGVADWIVLLSGYSPDVLRRVAEEDLEQSTLMDAGASPALKREEYVLSYSLAATDRTI